MFAIPGDESGDNHTVHAVQGTHVPGATLFRKHKGPNDNSPDSQNQPALFYGRQRLKEHEYYPSLTGMASPAPGESS